MPNGGQWEGEVPENARIREIVDYIGIKKNEIAYMNVNGKMVGEDYIATEKDKIIFVTNVEGG